jgi:hypothetical protein
MLIYFQLLYNYISLIKIIYGYYGYSQLFLVIFGYFILGYFWLI